MNIPNNDVREASEYWRFKEQMAEIREWQDYQWAMHRSRPNVRVIMAMVAAVVFMAVACMLQ